MLVFEDVAADVGAVVPLRKSGRLASHDRFRAGLSESLVS